MEEHEKGFGYAVERRQVLWMAPLALGLVARLADAAGRRAPREASGRTTGWDEFLARANREAKALYDPAGYDEDVYLHRLAAEAVQLAGLPADARTFRFGGLDPAVEFGPAFKGVPFVIIQWRLAPHAFLPPHNHPHYNVLTVGLEGEATVTHYEVEGEAPDFTSPAAFRVRRTRQALVTPRRVSPLSSVRDNIHAFQAGAAGARGIDITTLNGEDVGFSFLEIGDKPVEPERGIFEARWRRL